MSQLKVICIALVIIFVGVASAHHKSEKSIKERTAPVGKVYLPGDDVPVAKPAVVATSGPRDGATIYTQKCAMCHDAGIAGAPKTGDVAAWADRTTKGEDTLFANAINGFQGSAGVMPAKGGCADCSDDEIKAAVTHMLAGLK